MRSGWAGVVLASLACVGAAGCGGGGDDGATGELVQVICFSVAAEDGVVFSDRSVLTGGSLPLVGDLGADSPAMVGRQFLSFDLTGVPDFVTVVSATLRVDQFVVQGTPYSTHGNVFVDHLDFGTLDADDFLLRSLHAGLGPISVNATLQARSIDVTESVAQDMALDRPRSQYRLRFSPTETDNDRNNDYASFAEGEAATSGLGEQPTLILILRNR
jgi:hypothetical protein